MANLSVYLAMLLLGSGFSSNTLAKSQPPRPEPQVQAQVQLTEEEQQLVNLINAERTAEGLKPLRIEPILVEITRAHSKEMCDKSYFDHVSPTPALRSPLDRYLSVAKHKPKWMLLGENLFYCSVVDVDRGHMCLMSSPSHRDNILEPRFERVGVGVYKDQDGEFWATEMFVASID